MVSIALSAPTSRVLLSVSNFMTWVSSVIVVGITGYFLKNYAHDQHLIFQIVIAALTLSFWLPSFVLPFLKYKNYYGPLNFIFSYLWLTAFIFAAQDYNESSCGSNAPTGGSCDLKLTSEAFIFLAFFFSLVAFLADSLAWHSAAVAAAEPVHPEKEVKPAAEPATV